jgi:hypothetical protein
LKWTEFNGRVTEEKVGPLNLQYGRDSSLQFYLACEFTEASGSSPIENVVDGQHYCYARINDLIAGSSSTWTWRPVKRTSPVLEVFDPALK